MSDVWWELKYAFRRLAQAPLAPLAILATLGLGIGANLAVFSVIRATLVTPLPYDRPSSLVVTTWQAAGGQTVPLSPADLSDLRAGAESLSELAAYHPWTFNVAGFGPAERIPGAVVTANLFPLLGVDAVLGRTFRSDGPSAPPEVILSDGLWHRRFGGDRSVLGEKLVLDGEPVTVVGVMSSGFRFPATRTADLWLVSPYGPHEMPRDVRFLLGVGRLAAGTTTAGAVADVDRIAKRLAVEHPDHNDGLAALVTPIRESVVKRFERNLLFLQTAVALALLLACFNVAMIQLSRAEARREEVAVRFALGAGRRHIWRLAWWENLLLGIGGGGLGVLVALLGVPLLIRFGPANVHRLASAEVAGAEVAVALTAGILCSLLIGQLLHWAQARQHLRRQLGSSLRTVGSRSALRRVVVPVQVAVTLVLLSSTGLFLRSLDRLSSVPLGFDPDGVIVLGLTLPSEYASLERSSAFFHALQGRLEDLPGVEAVATAVSPPLVRSFRIDNPFEVVGQPAAPSEPQRVAVIRPVSPGYFELLRVQVVAGRSFTLADDQRGRPVVVVNRSFARVHLRGDDWVGRRVRTSADYGADVGSLPHEEWEVVGVVDDVQQVDLATQETPAIYVSTLQAPWMETQVLVKTPLDPSVVARRAEEALRELMPDLPVQAPTTLTAAAAEALGAARFQSAMLSVFSGFALLLMAVGLYGTLSYAVTLRSREIGLRMALGSRRWQTWWLIGRQALAMVVAGILGGLLFSFLTGRLIADLLFGISILDPVTYAGVSALVLTTALAAASLPARRVTSIDPARALSPE